MAVFTRKNFIRIFFFVILAATVSGMAFLFWKYRTASQLLAQLQNPEQAASAEVQQVVNSVNKLILLPEETPTVATVTDKSQLAGQPFFAKAENGDKVLIYPQAQRAYLYRPNENRLVDVATLNLETSPTPAGSQNPTVSDSQLRSLEIALYNGTSSAGLTSRYEAAKLADESLGEVVVKQNASRNDYTKSFMVDLTNGNDPRIPQLASTLGLSIEELPEGETAPPTQVLIILGSDQN